MLDKLEVAEKRYQELEGLLADPKVISDQTQYQKLARELSAITPIIQALRSYRKSVDQLDDLKKLLLEKHDKEFEDLARLELKDLEKKQKDLKDEIEKLLNPAQEEKDQDIIMEIRAGTGGDEASLFAGDLYRMYTKYAANKGWKVDCISHHPGDSRGF